MNINSSEEGKLIARCRQGDSGAWEALFERHYEPVCRFVFQLAADFTPEDVEEVCQDTFVAAVKHLAAFRGQSQLQTWLFRIAANKAQDFRQRRTAAKRGGGTVIVSLQAEAGVTAKVPDPPDPAPSPDTCLMNAERMVLIRRALDDLGEACREIIELRYFGDLSYEELAATLELNPKTVSSRLSKCLAKLEGVVQEYVANESSLLHGK